jgi:multicomponent Na+:H+ antiporter subunit E
VAVPVVGTSDQLLTLLADAVSLTPGTLALEVDRPGAVLYVHVLDLGGADGGVEGVRRSIIRLERLILQALGPAGQVQRALAAERAAARQVSS